MNKNIIAIIYAVAAAAFYALNVPCSKILLQNISPVFMAGLLYIGAGLGVEILYLFNFKKEQKSERLDKNYLPYTIGMIFLDIVAPILLMLGVKYGTSSNASLLGNFEIAATALIALIIFKEKVTWRLWLAILFITASSIILSFENIEGLNFSIGSLFVLGATICWGLENNCTRKLSSCDPLEIVLLKGIFSGIGSIVIGLVLGERLMNLWSVIAVMALGIVSYGLSIYFYVHAQRLLGAARTSAYYAVSPFIAAFLSILIFGQMPEVTYFIALMLMAVGAWYSSHDGIEE